MGSVLDEVRALGSARIQEIEAQARARADEILATADAEAERLREAAHREAAAPARRERAHILHQARQEALQIVGAARQELVERALAMTRERLGAFRDHPEYAGALQKLVAEALESLRGSLAGDERPCLTYDRRDRDLVERALAEPGREDPALENNLEVWGGVIARSPDNRVVVDNTLEARLARAAPFLRRNLPRLLAGDQVETASEEG